MCVCVCARARAHACAGERGEGSERLVGPASIWKEKRFWGWMVVMAAYRREGSVPPMRVRVARALSALPPLRRLSRGVTASGTCTEREGPAPVGCP